MAWFRVVSNGSTSRLLATSKGPDAPLRDGEPSHKAPNADHHSSQGCQGGAVWSVKSGMPNLAGY